MKEVPVTDVDLSAVDRKYTRDQRMITALVVVVALLAGAVAALVAVVLASNDLSAENRCLAATNVRYVGAVVATLADGDEESLVELLALSRKLDTAIIEGEDPCLVEIPPIE